MRLASDVPSDVARIITEESGSLPGRAGERRGATRVRIRPARWRTCSATRAQSRADELATLGEESGYLNDDQIGKTGVEATFEDVLRGVYGQQEVEQDALGRIVRERPGDRSAAAGQFTRADDRRRDPATGGRGPPLGDRHRRPAARRGHRDEPADGRGPGDGLAAHLRRQPLRPGHFDCRLPGADRGSEPPAGQLRHLRAVPAGIHLQAGDRHAVRWRTG